MSDNAEDTAPATLISREGWVVMHLFYHLEYATWELLGRDIQRQAKTELTQLVQEIRAHEDTQLLMFSMVSPKADLGFMLLTPDLHQANAFEKQLSVSLGPEILSPVYSYLSMTERSEYTTSDEQHRQNLIDEEGLAADSKELEEKVQEFNERMTKYLHHRLYPNLPEWPIFCFYPMSKRRSGEDNWYSLTFEQRKALMGGHAKLGRMWAGKILQLITGSTGIDDAEWGVTLFGHDLIDVKEIVYRMRFDEVSARYGEFGEFYIGLQLPLDELFQRLGL
ncbi:MAG: hydrogen peroxide-dependent heme synthase [Verrucomicrobiales bacterium]